MPSAISEKIISSIEEYTSHLLASGCAARSKELAPKAVSDAKPKKVRRRPKGEVQTFAKIDPKKMVSYKVDTEDFGSVLLKYGKADHPYVDGVHANAAISQVAAGWKCSLAVGIYGTEASVQWDLFTANEILVGRRDEPNQRRCRPARRGG